MDLFLNKILKFDFVKDSRSSLSFQRMADIQLKRRLDRSCLPQFQLWPIFDLSDKIISKFWTKVTLVHTVRCKPYLYSRGVNEISLENLRHFGVTFWHRCAGNVIYIYTVMTQYCKISTKMYTKLVTWSNASGLCYHIMHIKFW